MGGEAYVNEFKKYRRVSIAEARPFVVGEILDPKVSISHTDKDAGSPKAGDMIARNPDNHDDQWLIAADYFGKNFCQESDIVDKFLNYRLPDDFNPDSGISFTKIGENMPVGTNLLTATQAKQMLDKILS